MRPSSTRRAAPRRRPQPGGRAWLAALCSCTCVCVRGTKRRAREREGADRRLPMKTSLARTLRERCFFLFVCFPIARPSAPSLAHTMATATASTSFDAGHADTVREAESVWGGGEGADTCVCALPWAPRLGHTLTHTPASWLWVLTCARGGERQSGVRAAPNAARVFFCSRASALIASPTPPRFTTPSWTTTAAAWPPAPAIAWSR